MKDLYIHLPRRPRLMAVPLACLLLLAGCGGGSDEPEPTHASRYPTLAAHAAMDEEDFERYLLTAGKGTAITPRPSSPSRSAPASTRPNPLTTCAPSSTWGG